jgi:NADH-quinone oxidoreductase subunit A
MPTVLTDYLPIVAMSVLAVVFAVASMIVSRWFRPDRPNPVKLSPYECGNDPVRLPRGEKFSVKFYVVAMLFIIFDIETIFLFPWAVSFRQLGLFGLIEMVVFIALVFVAYVYIWRKGGLDWAETVTPVEARTAFVEEVREPELTGREVAGAR